MPSPLIFGGDNVADNLQTGLITSDGQDMTSGRRSRNFIRNRSAYRNTNGWVVSGACTVTRTTTAVEIVDGVASLKFAAGAAADYMKNAFTINNIQKSQPLNISFDFITQSGAAGDWDATIFDVTAATTIVVSAPSQGGSGGNLSAGNGTFNAFFISTTNTSYELRIVRKGGSGTFSAANFDIFQQQVRVGAAVTEWQSYTPVVAGLGTGSGTTTGFWRRVGDSLDVHINFNKDGSAGTGAASVTFSIPSSLTIDTTKYNQGGVSALLGTAVTFSVDVLNQYSSTTVGPNSLTVLGVYDIGSGSFHTGADYRAGSQTSIRALLPIANWSSNMQMADRSLEEFAADDGTNDVFGPNGAPVPLTAGGTSATTRYFSFPSTKQATDGLILEYNQEGNGWSSQNGLFNYITGQSGFNFGLRGYWFNPTTYVVEFGNGGLGPSSGLAAASVSVWSNRTTDRFRVRKVSSGAQIGGAIASINIVSDQQGVDIPAGNLGQEIRSYQSTNVAFPATGSYGDITSILLTPGVWDVNALAYANIGTATGLTSWTIGISTTSGNSAAGLTFGDSASICLPPTATTDTNASIPPYRVKITSNTTHYLKYNATYATGTPQSRGRLSAVRVR